MWPSVVTLALYLLLSWLELLPGTMVAGTALATYLLLGGLVTLRQIYFTLPRDLRGLYRYLKLQFRIRRAKRLNQSVPKIFRDVARDNADRVAFYFEDEKWTFREVDEFSNRVGNYFSARGIAKGDSVALFMENRVEYVCLWLGLTKIGCVPALINFHLRQEPLKHCIRVAKRCKAIVVGAELQDELAVVLDDEDLKALPVFVSGKRDTALKIAGGIDADEGLKASSSQVPPQLEAVGFADDMVYIYTSGTTGLPKAAVIKHSRGVLAVAAGVSMIGLDSNDIVYSPLPLYHLAAGILGSGMALVSGITVVLRKKFSASGYWSDCIKFRVTVRERAVGCHSDIKGLLLMPISSSDTRQIMLCLSGKDELPRQANGTGIQGLGAVPQKVHCVLRFLTINILDLDEAHHAHWLKAYFAALGMGLMVGVQSSCKDGQAVLYDALPLYHTAGGIIGVGQALFLGVSVVLRKKFSASAFWAECCRYKCTVISGSSSDYTITDYYWFAVNIDGKKGAVGFVSVLFPSVYPVALLKVDQDTGEILRGPDGLCIRCQPGEAGEFVGKIVRGDPVRDFHGYADETASKKKVVKDVFRKGDAAFLSGDILVMDEEGYLYFKDRTGDTFRWKGENVSTAEVEAIVSGAVGNADVVVYGVEVPGAEGRAGMAAVERKDDQDLDLTALYAALESSLAAYARPLFIRWASALERTGTFKLKKVPLQKEGFNPKAVKDPIFFLDGKNRKFIPLTEQLYEDIVGGRVRV
ncbi:LOW QUALITY PROTEIN: long-chain fatty acid transport protein 4-like [Penaeus chinensis]|uniref:LOW QUALITY PROTEIN: long-chain fatty acid transport protein 4-like n=1 Tax=Penaeus chinensis TaxID=139456 RepID=UPI001FB74944|nr:LOW QUALITY PROTEIN: long-chain fatty acid transport protein 4-like [Penaeus chinensis]